jgi:hypothetical protein
VTDFKKISNHIFDIEFHIFNFLRLSNSERELLVNTALVCSSARSTKTHTGKDRLGFLFQRHSFIVREVKFGGKEEIHLHIFLSGTLILPLDMLEK